MRQLLRWLRRWLWFLFHHRRPFGVTIIPRGNKMAQDIVEGSAFDFTVAFTNKTGRVLSSPVPTDAAATEDRADAGTVAVNLDGSAGVFTASAVDGPVNLTATAGGFTSAPYALNVVPDATVAGVAIVPESVGGVAIVP